MIKYERYYIMKEVYRPYYICADLRMPLYLLELPFSQLRLLMKYLVAHAHFPEVVKYRGLPYMLNIFRGKSHGLCNEGRIMDRVLGMLSGIVVSQFQRLGKSEYRFGEILVAALGQLIYTVLKYRHVFEFGCRRIPFARLLYLKRRICPVASGLFRPGQYLLRHVDEIHAVYRAVHRIGSYAYTEFEFYIVFRIPEVIEIHGVEYPLPQHNSLLPVYDRRHHHELLAAVPYYRVVFPDHTP